jgi:calcineurin-like phosphoesterase family protein
MGNTFLISDSHFGHANTFLKFKQADGVTPLRPFTSVEEMDETMVENWNRVVKPHDKVYHLGDVVINRKYLSTLGRLNGDKVLIKGNHDIWHLKDFAEHFRDIRGYHVMDGLIMSHVPIHVDSLARFGCNVHGHLHINRVLMAGGSIDPRYFNVGVECINYTPMSLEDVKSAILAQGGEVTLKNGNGPVL